MGIGGSLEGIRQSPPKRYANAAIDSLDFG
jgi:hypothetical protein